MTWMEKIKKMPYLLLILCSAVFMIPLFCFRTGVFVQMPFFLQTPPALQAEFYCAQPQKIQSEAPAHPEQPESVVSYVRVEENYFDDALFIGDSRTVGLRDYSGFQNATYFADTGLNIWEVYEKQISVAGYDSKIGLDRLLKDYSYGKIYIMLGINELGRGTDQSFLGQYRTVIDSLRAAQPQATIFVQSILHVSAEKDAAGTYINNAAINSRNAYLKTVEDGKQVFYLDLNPIFDDVQGKLDSQYTNDGVHLKVSSQALWREFLQSHGILAQPQEEESAELQPKEAVLVKEEAEEPVFSAALEKRVRYVFDKIEQETNKK